jgi:anaerobic ribonucleoside-triphosphate reductase activating protein
MLMSSEKLLDEVNAVKGIEGITFSGGEPVEQMEGCIEFFKRVREATDLSVLLYTGYTLEEIKELECGDEFLGLIDILVDGPYVKELRCDTGFLPSSNQRILILSERYAAKDIEVPGEFEIHIHPDGHIVMTGLPPKMGLV